MLIQYFNGNIFLWLKVSEFDFQFWVKCNCQLCKSTLLQDSFVSPNEKGCDNEAGATY